jgi:hypothetical protein
LTRYARASAAAAQDARHGDDIRRLKAGDPAEIILFEMYLFTSIYVLMGKGQAQNETAQHKKQLYPAIAIDEQGI